MRATLASDDRKIILTQRIVQPEVVIRARQGDQSRLLGCTQNGFTCEILCPKLLAKETR